LIVEFPPGVEFVMVIVTLTFVDVPNVAGSTPMVHCFCGCAEIAAPANASATIVVSKVIQVRKPFM